VNAKRRPPTTREMWNEAGPLRRALLIILPGTVGAILIPLFVVIEIVPFIASHSWMVWAAVAIALLAIAGLGRGSSSSPLPSLRVLAIPAIWGPGWAVFFALPVYLALAIPLMMAELLTSFVRGVIVLVEKVRR
jgi:hypothetical protein